MQDGLFFRVLRRFNILWVAIAGLIIIVGGGYHVWKNVYIRHELFGTHFVPPKAIADKVGGYALDPANYGSSDTTYGPWDGAAFTLSRINPLPDSAKPEAFENYIPREVVNLMMFDPATGESFWLFPTNKQTIGARDAVYEGAAKEPAAPGADKRPILGMVMTVTDAETNKSGMVSVYRWLKGSKSAVKLFTADTLLSFGQSGADRYVILYQKGKETHSAVYSLPDFKQLSDKRMPDAPK